MTSPLVLGAGSKRRRARTAGATGVAPVTRPSRAGERAAEPSSNMGLEVTLTLTLTSPTLTSPTLTYEPSSSMGLETHSHHPQRPHARRASRRRRCATNPNPKPDPDQARRASRRRRCATPRAVCSRHSLPKARLGSTRFILIVTCLRSCSLPHPHPHPHLVTLLVTLVFHRPRRC